MAKITVELPNEVAEEFLSWMSNSGEQDFMEHMRGNVYYETDNPNRGVTVDYPGWKDHILITEYQD